MLEGVTEQGKEGARSRIAAMPTLGNEREVHVWPHASTCVSHEHSSARHYAQHCSHCCWASQMEHAILAEGIYTCIAQYICLAEQTGD